MYTEKFTRIALDDSPGVNPEVAEQAAGQAAKETGSFFGNLFNKKPKFTNISNVLSIPDAMSWLKEKDPNVYTAILQKTVGGVGIRNDDGVTRTINPTLGEIIASPGKYEIIDPDKFNSDMQPVNKVLSTRIGAPNANNFWNIVQKAFKIGSIMTGVFATGIVAYNLIEDFEHGQPTSGGDEQYAMNALNADPGMQDADFGTTNNTNNQPLHYNDTIAPPPNTNFLMDPVPNTPLQIPTSNNQYDNMGYLKISNLPLNDNRRFAGFNIGVGLLKGSINPHKKIVLSELNDLNSGVTSPQESSQQQTANTSTGLLTPQQLLQKIQTPSTDIDNILKTFMQYLDSNPNQAVSYIQQQVEQSKNTAQILNQYQKSTDTTNTTDSVNTGASALKSKLVLAAPTAPNATSLPTDPLSALHDVYTQINQYNPIDPKSDVSSSMKNMGSVDDNADSPYDAPTTSTEQMLTNQQASASAVQAQGVNRDQYNQYQKDVEGILGINNAPDYIQNMAELANSSMQPVSVVMPTAIGVARRFPGQPDKAKAVMGVIAKYASEYPSANIWEMANNAATGKDFSNDLMSVRLMGLSKINADDFYNTDLKTTSDDTSDLSTALMALVNPMSPMGSIMDKDLMMRQQMRNNYQKVQETWGNIWMQARTERNRLLSQSYAQVASKLQKYSTQPWFRNVVFGINSLIDTFSKYRALFSISGANPKGFASNNIGQPQEKTSTPKKKFIRLSDDQNGQTGDTDPQYTPVQSQFSTPPADINQAEQQSTALQQGRIPANMADLLNSSSFFDGNGQQILNTIYTNYNMFNQAKSNLLTGLNVIDQGLSMGGDQKESGMKDLGMQDSIYFTSQTVGKMIDGLKPSISAAATIVNNYKQSLEQGLQPLINSSNNPNMKQTVQQIFSYEINQAILFQEKIYSAQITCQELPITLQVEIQIKAQIDPQIQQYETQFSMMPFPMPEVIKPLVSLYNKKAQLENWAGDQYISLVQKTTDTNLKQTFNQMAMFHKNNAATAAAQAQSKVSQLGTPFGGMPTGANMTGAGGGAALNGAFSSNKSAKFIRLAEEEIVEADKELEDYYNDLLPGYGTTLEHPQKTRGIPTYKFAPKRKFKRVRPKINLSE